MRPPFSKNRFVHSPTAGELVLFPPWLVHGIESTCGSKDEGPRVSLSFNLLTNREDAHTSDWEVLSDASFLMEDQRVVEEG